MIAGVLLVLACIVVRPVSARRWQDELRLCVEEGRVEYEYDGAGKLYINGAENPLMARNATSPGDAQTMSATSIAFRLSQCRSGAMGRALALHFDPSDFIEQVAHVEYMFKTNIVSTGSFSFNVSEAMTHTAHVEPTQTQNGDDDSLSVVFVRTTVRVCMYRSRRIVRA